MTKEAKFLDALKDIFIGVQFDVSTMERKQANEKRALVFEFKERRAGGFEKPGLATCQTVNLLVSHENR